MGICVPCLTSAMALFCVTRCGLESSLPPLLLSAHVMKRSKVKVGDTRENMNPLVGAFAGRLMFSGIWPEAAAPGVGGPIPIGGGGEWKRGLAWVAMGLPP